MENPEVATSPSDSEVVGGSPAVHYVAVPALPLLVKLVESQYLPKCCLSVSRLDNLAKLTQYRRRKTKRLAQNNTKIRRLFMDIGDDITM